MNPYRTIPSDELTGHALDDRWVGSNVMRATFSCHDELRFAGVNGVYKVYGVSYGAPEIGHPEVVHLETPSGARFDCDAELLIRARLTSPASTRAHGPV